MDLNNNNIKNNNINNPQLSSKILQTIISLSIMTVFLLPLVLLFIMTLYKTKRLLHINTRILLTVVPLSVVLSLISRICQLLFVVRKINLYFCIVIIII